MYHRTTSVKILLGAFSILIALMTGCRTYGWRDFRPFERKEPVVFFDRYVLQMIADASGYHNMYASFDLASTLYDSSRMDSLPVFTVDSLTFDGQCIDTPFSAIPHTWAVMRANDEFQGAIWYDGKTLKNEPTHYSDLYFIDGHIVPAGFTLLDAYRLPASCRDSSVTVRFHARLCDRKSGALIDSESKEVRFMIKNKKKLLFMS